MKKKETKIHTLELDKRGFDDLPTEKVDKMIGMYVPIKKSHLKDWDNLNDCDNDWDIQTDEETRYTTHSQDTAEILSSLYEIKAMLKLLLKR